MSLNNKVAIVTGASSGIGAAIAEKFSTEGALVVAVGRNEVNLSKVAARWNNSLVIKADLSNNEDIERIINETIKTYGKIDILVNNAANSTLGSILVADVLKSYEDVMNVNFRAVVHLTKLAAPHLMKTKGNIINISSTHTQKKSLPTVMMYNSSKAALNHFSKEVALELAPHVRVNVISPGPVRTNMLANRDPPITWEDVAKMNLLGRVSEAEEIADLALVLANDKAKGITGSDFVSDNGELLYF